MQPACHTYCSSEHVGYQGNYSGHNHYQRGSGGSPDQRGRIAYDGNSLRREYNSCDSSESGRVPRNDIRHDSRGYRDAPEERTHRHPHHTVFNHNNIISSHERRMPAGELQNSFHVDQEHRSTFPDGSLPRTDRGGYRDETPEGVSVVHSDPARSKQATPLSHHPPFNPSSMLSQSSASEQYCRVSFTVLFTVFALFHCGVTVSVVGLCVSLCILSLSFALICMLSLCLSFTIQLLSIYDRLGVQCGSGMDLTGSECMMLVKVTSWCCHGDELTCVCVLRCLSIESFIVTFRLNNFFLFKQ